MVVHSFNPNIWETEAGRSEASLVYRERAAWSTEQAPGHYGLHSETLSQKVTFPDDDPQMYEGLVLFFTIRNGFS